MTLLKVSSLLEQNIKVVLRIGGVLLCCCQVKICDFTKNKQGVNQCFHLYAQTLPVAVPKWVDKRIIQQKVFNSLQCLRVETDTLEGLYARNVWGNRPVTKGCLKIMWCGGRQVRLCLPHCWSSLVALWVECWTADSDNYSANGSNTRDSSCYIGQKSLPQLRTNFTAQFPLRISANISQIIWQHSHNVLMSFCWMGFIKIFILSDFNLEGLYNSTTYTNHIWIIDFINDVNTHLETNNSLYDCVRKK